MLEWIKNEKSHIKYLLFPLATIYRLIVFWRNVLYNHNFFISRKLPAKIISVGNITTGGTGKTPAVIFLTQHFLQKQKKLQFLVVDMAEKRQEHKKLPMARQFMVIG